jgi:hypothetical protein
MDSVGGAGQNQQIRLAVTDQQFTDFGHVRGTVG